MKPEGYPAVVVGDQDVPDVTGPAVRFNQIWEESRRQHRPAVWVERRTGGRWHAGADALTAPGRELPDKPYEALQGLCAALVRSGRALDASWSRERATASGLRTEREARTVAAVLAGLFAGHTDAATELQQHLID